MAKSRDELSERLLDRAVEQIEFNAIFAFAFLSLLAGALLALLLPWTWPRRFLSSETPWFLKRVWQDAGTFTELAFMG